MANNDGEISLRAETGNVRKKLKTCTKALENDWEHIYEDKFLTDIILKTKTKTFPVHKLVLCARSPVFKSMFSNNMKEANTDCIEVDDLDDDTVQLMLLFLYSDKLENLQLETAKKLYYASDKYELEKLKLICSAFFLDNLSTSTVIEILVLAYTHNDSDLLKGAQEFILDHDMDVFCSKEWEELMKIDSLTKLALQTMHFRYTKNMQISVEFAQSVILDSVKVKPSDTIESIKVLIMDKLSLPLDHQRLYFCGEVLEGGTLSDYNIENGSKLTFKLHLPMFGIPYVNSSDSES